MGRSTRQVFDRYIAALASGASNLDGTIDDLYDEAVVVEFPFARTEASRRVVGREAFRALAAVGRSLALRIDGIEDLRVHESTDPEVVVGEYTLAATLESSSRSGRAGFVVVLRVRDGRIVSLREYQDTAAMVDALTG